MLEIVNYVKSLVFPSELHRKRRAEDYDLSPVIAKMRKTGSSPFLSSEDHESSASSSIMNKHRNSLYTSDSKNTCSKENPLVTNVDENGISQLFKPKYEKFNPNKSFDISGKTRPTSTPRTSLTINGNSNDDVIFLGTTLAAGQKKSTPRKLSAQYAKPFSYLDDINKKRSLQNGPKMKGFSIPIAKRVYEARSKLGLNKRYLRSAALDQSYRLDEKRKYQELLKRATATNPTLTNSFCKYSIGPMDKFLRGCLLKDNKKSETESNKYKTPAFVDLTSNDNYTAIQKVTLSTKDTIEKVLKECDTKAAVASQPNVEFAAPPSPKHDFIVPRINSLKKIIDSTKYTDEEWLRDTIQKHRRVVTRLESEINAKSAHREKLKELVTEIKTVRLESQFKRYLKIKDAVLPVSFTDETAFPQISKEDECRIDDALNKKANSNDILSSKFNLNVTRRDMLTLSGLNWLNDEVINFYMNLIIERGNSPQFPKTHAMNTFFYPKLLKDGHASLKRWTRRIDIFSYDLLAVPIHLGVHWCMSIIDFRDKNIKYFDSMGSDNMVCLEALLLYLEEEHLDKKKSIYDTSEWSLENVHDIPQQMNGSDCGMFACTFAEVLTRDAKIKFSQDDMPYLRRKMVLEILNGELMIQ